MTIIAAKQFENKRTLFTDDCVTIGQAQVSAAKKYRPKLRELGGKNCNLIVASCGGTREIDLVLNLLEAKLEITKVKNTMGLTYLIQTVLIEAFKTLGELGKDPSVGLLILEPETNTLWHSDDYSVFRVNDDGEIIAGSGEQAFFSASKYKGFLGALRLAVMADEYCGFPLYAYRDGEMFSFYAYQDTEEMYDLLTGKEISHERTPICNDERREPSGLTECVSAKF